MAVSVTPSTISLAVGANESITTSPSVTSATGTVVSSNTDIATVAEGSNGSWTVTGVAVGTATVTVTDTASGTSATVSVTVTSA